MPVKQPKFDPTPKEIKAACEEIRAGWTANELARREAWSRGKPIAIRYVNHRNLELIESEHGIEPGDD